MNQLLAKINKPIIISILVASSVFAVMVTWSMAAPPYSGPDESAHVVRAVSVDRGQIIGKAAYSSVTPYTIVKVPQVFSLGSTAIKCYAFIPQMPASCSHHLQTSIYPVSTLTAAGHYPPLYYMIVGLPSLVSAHFNTVYLMRAVSALISAVMVGLTVYCIRRWSSYTMLPLGIMMAATPMTLYLGGMVNPNGFEITAALCLWISSIILFKEHRKDVPRGLLSIVVLSGSTLSLIRGLSPLWTIMIMFTAISLGSWKDTWSLFRKRRDIKVATFILFIFGLIAVIWIKANSTLSLIPGGTQITNADSNIHILFLSFRSVSSWLPQMVGNFGYLDTSLPKWVLDAWYIIIGAVFVLGVLFGKARNRVILIGAALMGFIVPVLIQCVTARQSGLAWQGRYLLPFLVGIPLLSVISISDLSISKLRGHAAGTTLAVILVVANVAAFIQLLRRYAVGASGSFNFSSKWQPPGGLRLIVYVSVIFSTLFIGSLLLASWNDTPYTFRKARRLPSVSKKEGKSHA